MECERKKIFAVIVAAYKAHKYITPCVNSILDQKMPAGWELDLRVGVDGCEKTGKYIRIPFYKSKVNVGAYVIRNSLILLKPADVYCYFDADDIMEPDFIPVIIKNLENFEVVVPGKWNCNQFLHPKNSKAVVESGGSVAFKHNILDIVGGFADVRVSADSDFMKRLQMARIEIKKIYHPLYLRRQHKNSLTMCQETGWDSPGRKIVWSKLKQNRMSGQIKILPRTVTLESVVPKKINYRLFHLLLHNPALTLFIYKLAQSIKKRISIH